MTTTTAKTHGPRPAAILVVPLVVAIVLTLFAWPLAKLGPRDLPIGVGGTPAATAPIEQSLAAQDGAFDIHHYADKTAAREAIADRDVYGAFVAAPGGSKMLIASAASPAVAQMLTHAASESGTPVQIEDVVSASPPSWSRRRASAARRHGAWLRNRLPSR
jgi:hypothetical protein